MRKNNLIIFVALILLTFGSFFFSEQSGETVRVNYLLLFAFLKVSLVAFYFMELKKAHRGWTVILGLVLVAYVVFIFSIENH